MSAPRDHGELVRRYREARRDPGLAVIEGLHALKHALRFDASVLDVRTRDLHALTDLAGRMAPDVAGRITANARLVDDATFRGLAPTAHPTGVIALARRPDVDATQVLGGLGHAPAVVLDRPAHHGNIGAAVRVAAAADAAGVLVTGPHDPWHPASVRGGAGLQFALPVLRVDELPPTGRPVVALDPGGSPLERTRLPDGAVLVFGSERQGLGEDLLGRAELRVAIPMRPGVSSLNLATAVAVALYGWRGG